MRTFYSLFLLILSLVGCVTSVPIIKERQFKFSVHCTPPHPLTDYPTSFSTIDDTAQEIILKNCGDVRITREVNHGK